MSKLISITNMKKSVPESLLLNKVLVTIVCLYRDTTDSLAEPDLIDKDTSLDIFAFSTSEHTSELNVYFFD